MSQVCWILKGWEDRLLLRLVEACSYQKTAGATEMISWVNCPQYCYSDAFALLFARCSWIIGFIIYPRCFPCLCTISPLTTSPPERRWLNQTSRKQLRLKQYSMNLGGSCMLAFPELVKPRERVNHAVVIPTTHATHVLNASFRLPKSFRAVWMQSCVWYLKTMQFL